jgi:hypothetical protein
VSAAKLAYCPSIDQLLFKIKYRVEFERMNLGDTDMDNIGASLLFGF